MLMLFTTPPVPKTNEKEGGGPIIGAIREGAQKSGVEFSYLVKTAKRESALDPNARAPRSTAEGLFQFVEQTWLGTLKEAGPKLGLGQFSKAIIQTRPGHYDVTDSNMRTAILSLRSDPKISSLLAGALTQSNFDTLTQSLGRKPNNEDLYLAHLLGAQGAVEAIKQAELSPDRPASSIFNDAARSNPQLFFDRNGRARTITEFRDLIASLHRKASESIDVTSTTDDPFPTPVYSNADGPALYSLFRNIGPVSPLSSLASYLASQNQTNITSEKPSISNAKAKINQPKSVPDDLNLTEEFNDED